MNVIQIFFSLLMLFGVGFFAWAAYSSGATLAALIIGAAAVLMSSWAAAWTSDV